MIGRLKGLVDGVGDGWVLIDVNGVCYLVEGSGLMLSSLPGQGEMVTLAIETYVREDQFRLFGFLTEEDEAGSNSCSACKGSERKSRSLFKVFCQLASYRKRS
ncbi:MAG: OB-fold domain-containing protein [Pseudomonadota bacterium]|nr:OB-fold domain-containing protein [Pseudomonadota bacterium]